ncbi:hypothetical protein F5141DRAFT_1225694 [Pisolithus sp. B1]|nr:hypothetical protein F5141DRAFT_1225694 [Pisolithus sp. B1]
MRFGSAAFLFQQRSLSLLARLHKCRRFHLRKVTHRSQAGGSVLECSAHVSIPSAPHLVATALGFSASTQLADTLEPSLPPRILPTKWTPHVVVKPIQPLRKLIGRVVNEMDTLTVASWVLPQVSARYRRYSTPKKVIIVPDLPKTQSRKIMRRTMRKIVAGEGDQLSHLSDIAEPSVVEVIKKKVAESV